MLACVLLAVLTIADPVQDSGRRPVPPAGTYERTLPLTELLAEVPADAWGPFPRRWTPSPATLELRRRAESGELTNDEWRTALIHADTIHTRRRWPAGEPLVLWVDEQAWLRSTEITVRAVEPSLGEVSVTNRALVMCGNCFEERKWRNRSLRLAPLPEGTSHVVFEVTILQTEPAEGYRDKHELPKQLWHGFVELPVEAVGTVEDVLPSTSDGTEAIRKALSASSPAASECADDLRFSLRGTYGEFPIFKEVGVALTVEVRNAGRVVGTTELALDGKPTWNSMYDFAAYGTLRGVTDEFRIPGADLSDWTVRIRSHTARALSIWEADRRWSGDFTVPLSELVSN